MLRVWALFAFGCAAAANAAAPTSLPVKHFVAWPHQWGTRTVKAAGLGLKIEPRLCGDRRPVSEGCWTGDHYMVVTVEAPGMAPLSIEGEAGVAHYIGVGELSPTAVRPSVFLITDSGGSGGCVDISLAVPDSKGYRVGRLGRPGSAHDPFCRTDPARLKWPRDLSGRGRPELRLLDDRFSCAFTSCAGSWYPPRIVAIDGLRSVDVSDDPAFAPLFRADMARARFACEHRAEEAQGPCAGFAADAARLGLSAQAWPIIEAQARRGCRVRGVATCPDGTSLIPATFPSDLRVFLRRTGYIAER